MTYDLLFLRKPADRDWEQVLRDHEARIGEALALESIGAPMQAEFDALERAIEEEAGIELRATGPRCFDLHVPAAGMQLHLFASEISLGVRLTGQRDEAREAAERMVRVSRLVERETSFRGYDPQLGRGLFEMPEPTLLVADHIVRIARTVDRGLGPGVTRYTWRGWDGYSGRA
jgi:hypothetical protein